MDYKAAGFWLDFWQLALTLAVGVYAWWVSRKKVTQDKIDKVRDESAAADKVLDLQNQALAKQVAEIEGAIKALPKTSDIGEVYSRMDEIHGDLKEVIGGQNAMNNNMQIILEHLVRENKS